MELELVVYGWLFYEVELCEDSLYEAVKLAT